MNSDVMKYYQLFMRSKFSGLVRDYSEAQIDLTIKTFNRMASSFMGKSMSRWQGQQIYDFLGQLVMTADEENSPESEDALFDTYAILSEFLRFLADYGALRLNLEDMDDLLLQFEAESGLEGPSSTPQKQTPPEVNNDPTLPEWREYVAEDIKNYVDIWLDRYVQSSMWPQRTTAIDANTLQLIVSTLAEKIYDFERKTPKTWTKRALKSVLTGYMVSNVNLDADDYKTLAPSVADFFDFVARHGWINVKRAADYRRFLLAIEPEMLAAAANDQNYGPAKKLANALRAAGIDVTDDAAVKKFINQLNIQGGIDALDNMVPEEAMGDRIASEVQQALNNPRKLRELATKYDLDKLERFLQAQHLPESKPYNWRRERAIDVHQQAVTLGLQLWATNAQAVVDKGEDVLGCLQLVTEFADVMYAQHLLTPESWTTDALRDFGQWERDYSKQNNRGLKQVAILTALLKMMGEIGPLNHTMSVKLIAAINGQLIPKPTKVQGGKVVSMKAARKLLKNKKR